MNPRKAIDETMALALKREEKAKALGRHSYLHDPNTDRAHIFDMWDKVSSDNTMTVGKLNRWLGWMQCSICSWGIMTLDEAKEINRRHS